MYSFDRLAGVANLIDEITDEEDDAIEEAGIEGIEGILLSGPFGVSKKQDVKDIKGKKDQKNNDLDDEDENDLEDDSFSAPLGFQGLVDEESNSQSNNQNSSDDEESSSDDEDEEEEIFGNANGTTQVSEELKAKLRERLNELKQKRQRKPETELTGKRSIERRRKKDRIKQQKNQKREKKKEITKKMKSTQNAGIYDSEDSQKKRKVELLSEENFTYSTFDLSTGKAKPSYLTSPIGKGKKISVEKKLKELQDQKQRLEKAKGTEEGLKMEQDLAWQRAFKKTEGEKVKDDINKLKKTIKTKQKKKEKSRQEWEKRETDLLEKQKAKQERRWQNIREHAMRKKVTKLQKKGRTIPEKLRAGFEGKRKTVLNKKKN